MTFAPLLPLWAMGFGGLLLLLALALTAARSPRQLWPRLLIAALAALIVANPVTRNEIREPSDDIALILEDRSGSMDIGGRTSEVEAAVAALRRTTDGIDWRVAQIREEPGAATMMGAAADAALAGISRQQLGAVFVVSDGISGDSIAPDILPRGVPLHLLLAGDRDMIDRRLIVESVPPYTIAGETADITVRVESEKTEDVDLTWRTSEGALQRLAVRTNQPVTVSIPIERRGPLDVALSVEAADGEEVLANNSALARLNGVTDRLSVLLVSGVPYPGGRLWRDLFKADPNIDLVHFTILRLPSSFDPTPPDQLALIPFPVEELFQERLADFDLIIFDRFDLTELMSPLYFQNLADRVEGGGGLLVVAGPEYDGRTSVAFTGLGRILPAQPAGPAISIPYRPALTDEGRSHPVTRTLPDSWGGTDWGRWGMIADVRQARGSALMTGPADRPLLMLDRVGEGRVGMIASTDIWWWTRAVDGAGPRDELLRRTAHWLMQEPDLEEEQLRVTGMADSLTVEADGMPSAEAVVIGPERA